MFPLKAVIASGTEDAQDAGRRRRGNSVAPVDVHEARRRLVTAATRARRGLFEIAVDQGLFHDVLAHRITRLHRQGDFADGLRELSEDPSLREFSLPDWLEGWGRSGPLRRLIQKTNRSAVISSIGSIVQATGAESGRQQQPAPPHKPPHTVRWSVALVASAHAIAWADRHERGRHAQVAADWMGATASPAGGGKRPSP